MLDLKAKLLAAGLVTKEQVEKAEADEAEARARREAAREARRHGGKGRKAGKPPRADEDVDGARWKKRLAELKAAGKSEQYDAIRGWVERHRLDQLKGISESAERFHFMKADGTISWVSVEPDVHEKLGKGEAGIIAYMGHNGLAHAVVPADVARDVHEVRPEWLRVLHGVTDAEPPAAAPAEDVAAPAEDVAQAGAPALSAGPRAED